MNAPPRVRSFDVPPPGGEYFCVVDGEKVSDRYWCRLRPRVAELMRRRGVPGTPEELTAASMCPYMPDWFCSGVSAGHVVRLHEARDEAKSYFSRRVVTFDEVSRRLRICSSCPMHDRTICLSCTGLLGWIGDRFGGRRVSVPEDRMSGTCRCARTFSAVVSSVEYSPDEAPWEDTPETCWRRT